MQEVPLNMEVRKDPNPQLTISMHVCCGDLETCLTRVHDIPSMRIDPL